MTDPAASTPFDADTDVQRVAPCQYRATITDRWHTLSGGPNGGYLVATCVRALTQELPYPDPVVVSAHFLRPAAVGPARIVVDVVKTGRRLATGEARLSQCGIEVLRVVATFTDLDAATGRTTAIAKPPRLTPPGDAVDPLRDISLPGRTIVDQVDYRFLEMPGWVSGAPSGNPTAEFWMRLKDREPDPISLHLMVDAAAPAVVDLGEYASVTIELTTHVRVRPAPGWLACRVATRHVINGFHEEDFEIWDSTGRMVAQSRQLAMLLGP